MQVTHIPVSVKQYGACCPQSALLPHCTQRLVAIWQRRRVWFCAQSSSPLHPSVQVCCDVQMIGRPASPPPQSALVKHCTHSLVVVSHTFA